MVCKISHIATPNFTICCNAELVAITITFITKNVRNFVSSYIKWFAVHCFLVQEISKLSSSMNEISSERTGQTKNINWSNNKITDSTVGINIILVVKIKGYYTSYISKPQTASPNSNQRQICVSLRFMIDRTIILWYTCLQTYIHKQIGNNQILSRHKLVSK